MNRLRKSRKGFSLVEMVLTIAIVMIIGGVVLGLCASISNMFIATYDIDDTADYALLYAKGFENSFLKNTQISTNQIEGFAGSGYVWTWYVNDPSVDGRSSVPTLRIVNPNHDRLSDVAVFTPNYMGDSASNYKWDVRMFFKYDGQEDDITAGNKTVKYRIFITDHAGGTDYIYAYAGSFWLPRFEQRAEFQKVQSTRKVYHETDAHPMNENTLKNIYGFSDVQYDAVQGLVEGDENNGFYDSISFYWGELPDET